MSATVTTIGRHVLHLGDCVEILRAMPGGSVDACVTDPPYGLGFMGKAWDCDVPGADFAAELFRVLKPGAHACLFGGTRTFHRLTVALEDAGFEVRDVLSWLYGTGFPKSLDVSKAIDDRAGAERDVVGSKLGKPGYHLSGHNGGQAFGKGLSSSTAESLARSAMVTAPATPEAAAWDGWGTALRPSWEPVILVRKPLIGTVAENVLAHGTGGINIDATRIEGAKPATTRGAGGANGRYAPIGAQGRIEDDGRGRWPANVVLDEAAAELLDAQAGERTGGASRFFYVAKPSRAERDRGCDALPVRSGGEATDRKDGADGTRSPRAGAGRTGGARNIHPTVKPVELMRWLVRLVTPPGGVVIDPFMGSGTTGIAVHAEHAAFVGIEREPEYFEIARRRVEDACRQGQLLALFEGVP